MSYQQFKNEVLGKGFNVDGHFGFQCWDGYAQWCIFNGVPYANCTVTGFVRDIWEQRHNTGILKYFDEVEVLQPGDVVVFKVVPHWTPYSHIAIFDSDAGGGFGWFLGQGQSNDPNNPLSGSGFTLQKLPYSATYTTSFRLKGTKASIKTKEARQTLENNSQEEDMFTISAEGRGIALMTGGVFYALLDAKDPKEFWAKGVPHIQVSVATFDNFQTRSNVGKLDDDTVKKLIDGLNK